MAENFSKIGQLSRPLVSIIIPVFNTEKYLEQAIRSAIDQTWPNTEIIIIDDGSTDGSFTIAERFRSNRLRIFHQQNKGSGAARNKGIAESKGEYVQFLDADDLLSSDKIEKQLNQLLAHPGHIAVCSTVHFFNGQDPMTGASSAYEDSFLFSTGDTAGFLCNLYGGNENRASMVQTNAWLTPMSVIKKAGPWAEFYSPDDDGEFFCRAVLGSAGVIYVDDCFNAYRKFKTNANNLASMKTEKGLSGKYQSFLLKKNHLLKATDSPTARKAIMFQAVNLAAEAYPGNQELTQKLLHIVKELGGTDYMPVIGGKLIEFIKKIFGWKIARTIQVFKQKLLS